MKWLYLIINVGAVFVPFLYSFEKKIYFIKYWKPVLISISITGLFYLSWDVIFTHYAIWGFNSDYLIGISILGLPIEEILFFFCIPYASIFMHYALVHFFPKLNLSEKLTRSLSWFLLIILLIVLCLHFDKWYTLVNYSIVVLLLIYSLVKNLQILRSFYITFLAVLIPFFIVNGILTGSFITEPVVWYNDYENLGIRLGTIPVEDIGYAFAMLYMSVLFIEKLKGRYVKG